MINNLRQPVVALIAAAACCAPFQAAAGTITGTISVAEQRPRRAIQRYQNTGGSPPKQIKAIPTIVFLQGPIPQAAALPPQAETIAQENTLFDPSFLVVPVGSTVRFPNRDDEFHNVFSYSRAKRFDLGRYRKGESKSVLFDKEGVAKIYCEIHSWMRAVVVVVANPYYAIAGDDGSFSLKDIPAGTYTLVVFNIDAGSQTQTVTVGKDSVHEANVELAGVFSPEVSQRELVVAALAEPGVEDSAEGASLGCCHVVKTN